MWKYLWIESGWHSISPIHGEFFFFFLSTTRRNKLITFPTFMTLNGTVDSSQRKLKLFVVIYSFARIFTFSNGFACIITPQCDLFRSAFVQVNTVSSQREFLDVHRNERNRKKKSQRMRCKEKWKKNECAVCARVQSTQEILWAQATTASHKKYGSVCG